MKIKKANLVEMVYLSACVANHRLAKKKGSIEKTEEACI